MPRHEWYSSCNSANLQPHVILRQVSNYLTSHGTIDDLVLLMPLRIEALRAVGKHDAADSWQKKLDEEMAIRTKGGR